MQILNYFTRLRQNVLTSSCLTVEQSVGNLLGIMKRTSRGLSFKASPAKKMPHRNDALKLRKIFKDFFTLIADRIMNKISF